jgi:hypothetical protein
MAVGVALVLLLGGGYVVLANVYMPLTQGSGSAPGPAYFLRATADRSGGGSLYVYCSQASGTFAWHTTLRNSGVWPVTVLGGAPGPGAVTEHTGLNSFSLVDLALYRDSVSDQPTAPGTAASLAPTMLNPGDEVDVWARYRTGSIVLGANARASERWIFIRYAVLGVERTAEVPLRDGVAVEGPPAGNDRTAAGDIGKH